MRILILLFLLFAFFRLQAQDELIEFQYLSSSGEIPEVFFPDDETKESLVEDWIRLSNNKLTKKEAETYVDKQTLAINQLLESGKILFNDPVGVYLNQILKNLLHDKADLKDEIQVFAFKSNSVNAFMMPNGMMFVNLGLVAETTNEAQLAFVMAHEIIHFTKHHSIDQYIEKLNRDWDKDNYITDLLNYHARSRQHESESDRLGLEEFFASTSYSYEAISEAFDVLQYGYLPFDELPFNRSEIETKDYRFKDKYFIESVNPIRSRDDYIDTLSTHPNLKTRRYELNRRINSIDKDQNGRKKFVQDKALYFKIRDLARFECINQDLYNKKYVDAFYNIRILQQSYPENEFLEIAEATSLYGLEVFSRKFHRKHLPSEKKVEGEIHALVRFLRKISKNELTLLSLRSAWAVHQKYPDNNYINGICDDLFERLHTTMKVDLYDFADLGMFDTLVDDEEVILDVTKGDKYDRVKKEKAVQHKKGWKTWNYMLVDFKKDTSFMDKFYQSSKESEIENLLGASSENVIDKKQVIKQPVQFVLINPKSYRVRVKESADRIDNKNVVDKSDKLAKQFSKCAELLNIEYEVVNGSSLNNFSYASYAKYLQLYGELVRQQGTGMEMYSFYNLFSNDTAYSDEHFIFLEQISYKESIVDFRTYLYGILGSLKTPLIPVVVYELFTPRYRTRMLFHLFIRESGDRQDNQISQRIFIEKLRDDYIMQHLYTKLYESKAKVLTQKGNGHD